MTKDKRIDIDILPKEIRSLSDFIKLFEEELAKNYQDEKIRLYFRGEKEDYENPCQPSLFRKKNNDFKNLTEDEIYYRTLRRQPDEFYGLSNLDILAKMQHYGVPTRFLDITTNPLIALFFALEKSGKKDGYVYIFEANHEERESILSYDSDRALLISTLAKLNDEQKKHILKYCNEFSENKIYPTTLSEDKNDGSPIWKNKKMISSLGKFIYECERERHAFHKNHQVNPKDLTKIYFAKPRFSNERLKSQDGLFILFGLGIQQYDQKIIGIKIPYQYKKKIMAELFFFAGITNSKVFHGIEALSKDKKDELYGELVKDYKSKSYNYNSKVVDYLASEDRFESSRYYIKTKGEKSIICIGLNPSTADMERSDLTINRIEEFAKQNGYDSIIMLNLYPLRESNPSKLPIAKDPIIYAKNIAKIKEVIAESTDKKVLIATGEDILERTYFLDAIDKLIEFGDEHNVKWYCVGTTAAGLPKHPSRARYISFQPYNLRNILRK